MTPKCLTVAPPFHWTGKKYAVAQKGPWQFYSVPFPCFLDKYQCRARHLALQSWVERCMRGSSILFLAAFCARTIWFIRISLCSINDYFESDVPFLLEITVESKLVGTDSHLFLGFFAFCEVPQWAESSLVDFSILLRTPGWWRCPKVLNSTQASFG